MRFQTVNCIDQPPGDIDQTERITIRPLTIKLVISGLSDEFFIEFQGTQSFRPVH